MAIPTQDTKILKGVCLAIRLKSPEWFDVVYFKAFASPTLPTNKFRPYESFPSLCFPIRATVIFMAPTPMRALCSKHRTSFPFSITKLAASRALPGRRANHFTATNGAGVPYNGDILPSSLEVARNRTEQTLIARLPVVAKTLTTSLTSFLVLFGNHSAVELIANRRTPFSLFRRGTPKPLGTIFTVLPNPLMHLTAEACAAQRAIVPTRPASLKWLSTPYADLLHSIASITYLAKAQKRLEAEPMPLGAGVAPGAQIERR